MTALPAGFEAEFDENGNLVVSADAAAVLRDQLGHDPQPGEKVNLAVVGADVDFEYDDAAERWLRSEGVAAYDRMQADPSRAITSRQLEAHFDAVHAEHVAREQ